MFSFPVELDPGWDAALRTQATVTSMWDTTARIICTDFLGERS